jgi:ATP-dependent protease Clp ATPase subunit
VTKPDQSRAIRDSRPNSKEPLWKGGIDAIVHLCDTCAARMVAQTTPQPSPEPATPPVPPSKEERIALVPSPKSVVAHLDQFVIGLEVAKRRVALGVSNHFKRVVDTWVANDLILTDPNLKCS